MKALRLVAAVEAVTLLVLLGAVIAYRVFEAPDLTSAIGPVHGLLFVSYAALAVHVGIDVGWSARRIGAVVLAAALPAGGFVVAEHLARRVRSPLATQG